MNFIQKTRFQFLTIGLFLMTLLFSQCKPINQTGSGHQISAAKQEAMAKIFDDAKIIKQYQWKDYLEIHPHLIEKFDSLNVSNGFFYDILKPGSGPITVAFSKDRLTFLGKREKLIKYTGTLISPAIFDKYPYLRFYPAQIGFNCFSGDGCKNAYHQFDTGCAGCGGVAGGVDFGIREIHDKLYF